MWNMYILAFSLIIALVTDIFIMWKMIINIESHIDLEMLNKNGDKLHVIQIYIVHNKIEQSKSLSFLFDCRHGNCLHKSKGYMEHFWKDYLRYHLVLYLYDTLRTYFSSFICFNLRHSQLYKWLTIGIDRYTYHNTNI